MTYDALLSLRGWGEREFRLARPDFLDAARFAIFAERLGPMLAEGEAVMAASLPTEPHAKLEAAVRKEKVAELIPVLRRALHLEGDDG